MKILVITALVSAAVAFRLPERGFNPPTNSYDPAPAHTYPAHTPHDDVYIHHPSQGRYNKRPHTPTYPPPHTNTYTPPHTTTYRPPHTVTYPTHNPCGKGEVRKGDGSCVRPIVTKNFYLYDGPKHDHTSTPPNYYPDPKVHYNYVFLRNADGGHGYRPIVAPAPKQKTLVYVLSKRPEDQDREVIEVPVNPSKPEVFFVKYSDGDNAKLPGGIDLQTALSQSAHQGQVIHGTGGGSVNHGGNGYSDEVHGDDHIHGNDHDNGVQYNGDNHGHGDQYDADNHGHGDQYNGVNNGHGDQYDGDNHGNGVQYNGNNHGHSDQNNGDNHGHHDQYNGDNHGNGVQYNGDNHGNGVQYNGDNHGHGVQYNGDNHGHGVQYNGDNHGNGVQYSGDH